MKHLIPEPEETSPPEIPSEPLVVQDSQSEQSLQQANFQTDQPEVSLKENVAVQDDVHVQISDMSKVGESQSESNEKSTEVKFSLSDNEDDIDLDKENISDVIDKQNQEAVKEHLTEDLDVETALAEMAADVLGGQSKKDD